MSAPIDIKSDSPESHVALRRQQMSLEAGLVGWLFGTGANAPMNIAGFIVVVLVVAGMCTLIWSPSGMTSKEFWGVIVPLLTLVIGYVFGKGGD